MKLRKICILGGTGFVGRHLVARLADGEHSLCIPSRRPQRYRSMLVHPGLTLCQADIHDVEDLTRIFQGMDVVINLVGILNETRRQSFQTVHVALPAKVVQACEEAGVRRLLHMSALHANAEVGPSAYLFSKGKGEDLVFEKAPAGLAVSSFRPSVIFSPGDHFLNRFAQLLKIAPYFFPLACPDARFAPVYIDDVVTAMTAALTDQRTYSKRFDLCGTEVYTLKQIVELVQKELGLRRKVVGLSAGLSRLQARILEWVPGKPLTRDNLLSLKIASICRENHMPKFDIEPTLLSAVIKQCLAAPRHRRNYEQYRRFAGR